MFLLSYWFKLILEVVFVGINYFMASIEVRIRDKDLIEDKTGGIVHWEWAVIYSFPVALVFYFIRDWWLLTCLMSLHLLAFNPIFNKMEGATFFHLGTVSITDKILTKIYIPAYFTLLAIFLFLQYIMLKHS